MKLRLLIIGFLMFPAFAFSQKEVRQQMKTGNKEYKQEKFTEAEISYRKALEANARSTDAAYNLGNALYKQGKFQEAAEQYAAVVNSEKDKEKLHNAWHNMGNIFMNAKDYAKSIDAYKRSLRNNPNDDQTRYNLALAQKLLEDQEQNEDQNQDQNQDQDQNQEQEKEQQQDQQQDQQEQQQEQQQQNEQMSQENAQQILDALLQDEKDTQEKVQQMKKQQRKKADKEW